MHLTKSDEAHSQPQHFTNAIMKETNVLHINLPSAGPYSSIKMDVFLRVWIRWESRLVFIRDRVNDIEPEGP